MYLALQITEPAAAASGQNSSKVFSETGGTIGRADDCDWVLHDPGRFISGQHAIVRCINGAFSLEDVSTNGTFINEQEEAIGSLDEPAILKDGDRIRIGKYEIRAAIVESPSIGLAEHELGWSAPDEGYQAPLGSEPPLPTPELGAFDPVDPLEVLGNASAPTPEPTPATPPSHSPLVDHFDPPRGNGGRNVSVGGAVIPEDWAFTDYEVAATGPPDATPPPSPATSPPVAGPIQGPDGDLRDRLMSLIVAGVMDVLKARTEIKSEVRLPLTVIRPRENNPLKFSPDASAAMEHLFGSRKPGYLSAEQAFAEAFDDIKAHQVAMLAGMRAAFEHMLQQFSPAALEEQFDGKGKRGGLMGRGGKARYWEMYQEFFERITRDSDDNFRRLFGEEFAAAYEDQMKRITRRK